MREAARRGSGVRRGMMCCRRAGRRPGRPTPSLRYDLAPVKELESGPSVRGRAGRAEFCLQHLRPAGVLSGGSFFTPSRTMPEPFA